MTAICALTSLLVFSSAPYDFQWPLDLPRELSSSFAEYRPGRFHAGIDLRTAGTGRGVHAAGKGYVSRVRCSPYGYGKAVYLQLDTGHSVIYAHLEGYDDALTDYVRAAQHAKESYTVDLYPAAGQFPVERGQLIARSGQTGIGAPHLHFEMRDKDQRPIAPRALGLDWPDDTPPVLTRVLAVPRNGDDRINGDLQPIALTPRAIAPGEYVCDPILARGEMGFGIDFYDPAGGGNKMGAHEAELIAGGESRFTVRHDLLSYDNIGNGAVAYFPCMRDKGRFLLLWRWPGNVCPSYAVSPGDGWVTAGQAGGSVELRVTDSAGNASHVTIGISPLEGDPGDPAAPGTSEGAASFAYTGNGLLFTVRFPLAEPETPVLQIARTGAAPEAIAFNRTGARLFRVLWEPAVPGEYTFTATHARLKPFTTTMHAFLRGEAGSALMAGVRATVPASAPYGMLYFQAAQDASIKATLPMAGPAFVLGPEDAPMDSNIGLSFPIPAGFENSPHLGIYRKSGSSWSWVGGTRSGGDMTVSVSRLGTYAFLNDESGPLLTEVLPAEGYHATTRRPYVRATVTDPGSGIAGVEARCDGAWLLTAYDPERRHMEWERDEELAPGEHEIVLRAWDEAGNETTVRRKVVIPE